MKSPTRLQFIVALLFFANISFAQTVTPLLNGVLQGNLNAGNTNALTNLSKIVFSDGTTQSTAGGGGGGGISTNLLPAKIYIGNALSNATAAAVSGDATLATNGALTLANSSQARTDLGLGTAATANTGIGANDIPQYDGAGNLAVYDTFTLANGSAFYFDNGFGFLYSQNGGTVSAVTTIPLNGGGTGQTTPIAAITALGGPYQPTNSSLTTLSDGVATPILGTSSTTALAGNTTAATLGAIAANAGAGTNNSLVNPTLSGIESNSSSGTYIGTNLFTNGATFYAMTNYPKNLIGNGVSTLFTVNSSNHRHLWTITSGSLPAGALPGWDIILTNLQFKIVMINSSTSFWTFDGGGSDFTGASVTAMYPNAVDWTDINHTPNGGVDDGAGPFVQTIVGPTGNNGRIILGGGTNTFQLTIGSFNDGTDFTIDGMGGSNSAIGPTAVMTLNGQAPTSIQVFSNGIVNLSSRTAYGVSMGDYLNLNGVDASTFPPQLVWPTYSTTAARPYIVWDGNNNWMGIGPANTSDNTVRFGWTTGPFNGSSSEWPTFGTHASPYEFDSSTFGIGVSVPTHALDVSGTTAANFHQGIATMEDVSGSITATGWTNALGTNAWVWPFGTAVTYIIFDAAGTPIVTNVTISTTDATGQPIQAGGKLTAASGLTGRYMAQ